MADYRIGFKWWALIIAVVFVISELVCVACVPERPVACDEKRERYLICLKPYLRTTRL